ncbi:FkbM family methyltransferase [Paenibacillus sp. NPDC057967]|uniref:FkbM family methyltransferase n=1 Tax=Paenibacillus sp. NPDC057967 TaxID=3346293 RepID=UPI0036DDFEC2
MKLFDDANGPLTIVQIAPDYYPVPPPAYGGIERVVHTLTERLVGLGHRVILYAPEGSATSAELNAYTHGTGNPEGIRDTVVRTLPTQVDIIHDHTHSSVIGKLNLPIPTVCTLHATVHNHIEHPVYISRISQLAAGDPAGCFIYNGVSPNEFDYAEQKSDFLLYMGVISPHKGIHHAIHIAEATGQKLVIAGPVYSTEYFQAEIEPALRRNPLLQYVGEVGGIEKRRLLKEARCMLFPTCCEEAFGLVMVEAMMSGTPVLALANGAVPEVMSGFPELVCQSVEEMLDKAERSRFPSSPALRSYAMSRFIDEEMARQYVQLYRRLLAVNERTAAGIEQWKALQRSDQAIRQCELIHQSKTASLDDRLHACYEAAEIWHEQGDAEQERVTIYRSFEYAAPRAEFCCKLGYLYLEQEDYAKAAYWYKLATEIEPPSSRTGFYKEACWTWLPHLQLCICRYHMGDIASAYRHNEIAREYYPNERHILFNKTFLEPLLANGGSDSGRQVEVQLNGVGGMPFRMRLALPGFLEETIAERGAWEPELARRLSRYVESGGIFIDIGANIGYHTLYMASKGEDIQCLAFEPHPDICGQLAENVKLNGYEHVEVYAHALSDRDGKLSFFRQSMTAYNRGLSGATISDSSASGGDFEPIEIEARTLDQSLTEQQRRHASVIKIDTQGYEFEALHGAMDTIRESQPVIAFEYHPYGSRPLEAIIGLLEGYTLYKLQIWTGELRRLDEEDPAGFEQDYICIPGHLEPVISSP